MTIPAAVATQLTALQAAFTAASPIDTTATRPQILGLQFRAVQLVNSLDAAIPAAAGALDTFTAPAMPQDMAAGVLGLLAATQAQVVLADMRGVIGRALSNLEQVQGI